MRQFLVDAGRQIGLRPQKVVHEPGPTVRPCAADEWDFDVTGRPTKVGWCIHLGEHFSRDGVSRV